MPGTRFPTCSTRRLAALIPGAVLLGPAAAAQVTWDYTAIADSSAELASFKVPRRWVQVDALPRTALGKVQKHLLAARAP